MNRILHIASGDLWAGAEAMLTNLVKGLSSQSGLAVSAVLFNEGRLAEELRALDADVYVIEEAENNFLSIHKKAKEVAQKVQPGVIHSHGYKEHLLALLLKRHLGGVRVIGTQHGLPEAYQGLSLKRRSTAYLNLKVLSRFDHVVAVSDDIRDYFLKKHGFAPARVAVIHNGIEVPGEPLDSFDNGRFVIGSSGRFYPVKDYPFMVEVAREVFKTAPSAGFELAGDGPERERIKSLIADYGLEENFVLKGFTDDIMPFYRRLAVYINTSVHEGIPLSVLEAMSCGLPVVAPDTGGLKEIIDDGADGFLVKERDPSAFAGKCAMLYNDRRLLARMSAAAREKIIKDFSLKNMVAEYTALYNGKNE